jgi:thiamine biosynthesis protein ThiS
MWYARPELKIRLNGDPHELAAPLTVTALLAELGIDPRRVAVEHNQIVVKRAAYDDALIGEGDEVEIVNFVGGGAPYASTTDAARGFQRAATSVTGKAAS